MKMPDGEVLKGKYSALRDGELITQSFTNSTARMHTTGTTQFTGQVQGMGRFFSGTAETSLLTTAILSSYGISSTSSGYGTAKGWLKSTTPGSTLFMEVAVCYGLLGGGFGVAVDHKHRVWKIYIGG